MVDQPSLALAFRPLAFPTIVTPYGIATLIVLLATMKTLEQQEVVLGLIGVILLLNWAAMLFARPILHLFAISAPVGQLGAWGTASCARTAIDLHCLIEVNLRRSSSTLKSYGY